MKYLVVRDKHNPSSYIINVPGGYTVNEIKALLVAVLKDNLVSVGLGA